MTHIPYEQWLTYANDKLNEETRVSYETHLYECDECLETYMKVIETIDIQEPTASTDDNIKYVHPSETKSTNTTSGYKKTLLHYSVAVAMTFLLMSTGVFKQLIHIDIDENQNSKTSFVTELLNSPFSIIDKFKESE